MKNSFFQRNDQICLFFMPILSGRGKIFWGPLYTTFGTTIKLTTDKTFFLLFRTAFGNPMAHHCSADSINGLQATRLCMYI
jgi:hypothetical protein